MIFKLEIELSNNIPNLYVNVYQDNRRMFLYGVKLGVIDYKEIGMNDGRFTRYIRCPSNDFSICCTEKHPTDILNMMSWLHNNFNHSWGVSFICTDVHHMKQIWFFESRKEAVIFKLKYF